MQREKKKQAEENCEDVTQRMTPKQITEAKRHSEQCRSQKFNGWREMPKYLCPSSHPGQRTDMVNIDSDVRAWWA